MKNSTHCRETNSITLRNNVDGSFCASESNPILSMDDYGKCYHNGLLKNNLDDHGLVLTSSDIDLPETETETDTDEEWEGCSGLF